MIENLIPKHILKYLQKNPNVGRMRLKSQFNISENDARYYLRLYDNLNHVDSDNEQIWNKNKQRIIEMLKKKPMPVDVIAKQLAIPSKTVRLLLTEIKEDKYNLQLNGENYEISNIFPIGKKAKLDYRHWKHNKFKFGAIADTHLGSDFERLDVLNTLYDIFADEGIDTVYHGGNYIDGECKFNKYEIHTHGLTPQIEYMIENYPKRDGITTYIISGDDHEGWFAQREKINIGEYMEMKARRAGRNDLIDMGYLECDIELEGVPDANKQVDGHAWMRLMHGGGGTAYAVSYTPQKIVESLQGGEKPSVLLLGHYHKFDHCYPREVHTIQLGCTQDQTKFMRKKKLQAMVGGCIIELNQAADGTINRCKVEFISFFDKGFYKGKTKYWR